MKTYEYALFDVDGTLTKKFTNELLSGVAEWFAYPTINRAGLVTNQGGVGLTYWNMVLEKPYAAVADEGAVLARLTDLVKSLQQPLTIDLFAAFAYQRNGEWGPTPNHLTDILPVTTPNYSYSWLPDWRKPNSGMLNYALRMAGVLAQNAVMVGDRLTDKLAAEAAGIDFLWAYEFFNRPGRPETG